MVQPNGEVVRTRYLSSLNVSLAVSQLSPVSKETALGLGQWYQLELKI